jgi:hypothetical protein
MTKIFVLLTFILLPIFNYGQVLNSCYPEFTENISDEIISKLTKSERKEINSYNLNTEKDWLLNVNINLNNKRIFNYNDFLPIIEYSKTKGSYNLKEWQLERILTEYIFNNVRGSERCLSDIIENRLKIIKKEQIEISNRIKLDTIDGTYIPTDLNDAINQINKVLAEESKLKIKKMNEEDFIAESHFGIGFTLIRNGWALWGKSRLSKYFNEIGINHPDDMSGIILTSYFRKLKKKPIELEKQILDINEYYIKNLPPSKMEYPSFVTDVRWENSVGYPEDDSEENWAEIHFFFSLNKKIIWIYNYNYGWKQLTKKQYRQFEKVYDYEILNWLRKIYKIKN